MSVVFITGAGSGMGAAHARLLSRRGFRVVCSDAAFPTAQAVADECGERAMAVYADVRDAGTLRAAVDEVFARWGRVDALIANAGVTVARPAPVWSVEEEDWQRVIDVNLSGVWRSISACAEAIIAARGSFVLISSVAGLSGAAQWGAYSAAKHGVVGLMRTLANELAGTGARCNAVCPGMVSTRCSTRTARCSVSTPATRTCDSRPDISNLDSWLRRRCPRRWRSCCPRGRGPSTASLFRSI